MRVLLICLLSFSLCKAQPVLKTSEFNFHAGSMIVYSNTEALFVEAGGMSFDRGANITWNFSDLKPGSNDTLQILDADNTPFRSYFSKADIAVLSNGFYSYIDISSAGIEDLGGSSADNFNLFYIDAALTVPTVLNYGDQVSDTFISYENLGGLSTDRHGKSIIKYEGYGTVILADVIYDSVMLISYERSFSDQDGNEELLMEYCWMVKNDPFPVLKYNGRKAGNDFFGYMQVRSGLQEIISVNEEAAGEQTAYYNSQDNTLRFNNSGANEKEPVYIINSSGALVYEGLVENGFLTLPDLSKGMYSVAGKSQAARKIKFLIL